MINSNTALAAKRRMSVMPIVSNVKAGANGELSFSVTICPELLDPVMGLIKIFSAELRRAMQTRDFWSTQASRERIEYEQGLIDFQRRKRLTLSVWRRTGSAQLAASAGGWQMTEARFFINDAQALENKMRRKSRNAKICNLAAIGMSRRNIADQFGLSAGQVSRIANG